MPRRANSFGPLTSGVACILLAAVAAGSSSPAQADCITQPNEQAPDGTHWSLHLDHVKNRRCWILVDSAGREISTAPEEAPPSTLSSLQSFLSNLTGTNFATGSPPPAPPPPPPPPQETPAASPTVVHRPPAQVATTTKPGPVHPEQKGEAHPVKHELTDPERDALFEEFLRWHESQQMTGAEKQQPR
jgi:hypothetical protein